MNQRAEDPPTSPETAGRQTSETELGAVLEIGDGSTPVVATSDEMTSQTEALTPRTGREHGLQRQETERMRRYEAHLDRVNEALKQLDRLRARVVVQGTSMQRAAVLEFAEAAQLLSAASLALVDVVGGEEEPSVAVGELIDLDLPEIARLATIAGAARRADLQLDPHTLRAVDDIQVHLEYDFDACAHYGALDWSTTARHLLATAVLRELEPSSRPRRRGSKQVTLFLSRSLHEALCRRLEAAQVMDGEWRSASLEDYLRALLESTASLLDPMREDDPQRP